MGVPACAEKSLRALCHFFGLAAKSVKNEPNFMDATGKAQIDAFLLQLDEQVRQENISSRAVQEGLSLMQTLVDKLQFAPSRDLKSEPPIIDSDVDVVRAAEVATDAAAVNAALFAQLLRTAERCLGEIRLIDTDLLVRLLQNTLRASAQIEGKDVILLLGNTGAGKSTTIHFLGGSTMRMIDDKKTGRDHIEILHSRPQLESFVTSVHSSSETLNINAIELEADGITFTLCDTPGFGDNRGVEIDISNGLGIANAMRVCRSVRPLFLISQQQAGDRFDGVVELLKIPIEFMRPVESVIHTFSYWFTKYEIQKFHDSTRLYLQVQTKLDSLSVTGVSDSVLAVMEDMVEKIDRRGQIAVVVDPVNDHPASLLRELLDSPAIENPAEVFQNYATPQNLIKLKVQLGKHVSSVENACDRNDFPLVLYKLKQLQVLKDSLLLQDTTKAYSDCLAKIDHSTNAILSGVMRMLDKCAVSASSAIEPDLRVCAANVLQLLHFDGIRAEHSSDSVPFRTICESRILAVHQQHAAAVSEFCHAYADAAMERADAGQDNRKVVLHQLSSLAERNLEKMKAFANVFGPEFNASAVAARSSSSDPEADSSDNSSNVPFAGSLESVLSESVRDVHAVAAGLYTRFADSMMKMDYAAACSAVLGAQFIVEVLSRIASGKSTVAVQCAGQLTTLKATLQQELDTIFSNAHGVLMRNDPLTSFSADDYQTVHRAASGCLLVGPTALHTLRLIFPESVAEKIANYFPSLVEAIRDRVRGSTDIVKHTLASRDKEAPYAEVKVVAESVLQLRACTVTAEATLKEFSDFSMAICNPNRALKEDLSQTVNLLINDSWFIDCDSFIAKLDRLKSAECLKNVGAPGLFYAEEYEFVNEQLRGAFVEIMQMIHNTDLSYQTPEVLQRFVQPMKVLAQFSGLFEHTMEMDAVESEDAAPSVQELLLPSKSTESSRTAERAVSSTCSHCKASTWRLYSSGTCKVCFTRVHKKCSTKMELEERDGKWLRICNTCLQFRNNELEAGAAPERASLVMESVTNLDDLIFSPPTSTDTSATSSPRTPGSSLSPAERLPPSPQFVEHTPVKMHGFSIFGSFSKLISSPVDPPSPPPRSVVTANSKASVASAAAAQADKKKISSGKETMQPRKTLNFNKANSLTLDALDLNDGQRHSIATIATRIVIEFRDKVRKQLTLARKLFPEQDALSATFRMEFGETWSAVQFLKNATVFDFPEVAQLESCIRAFIDAHFRQLQQELLKQFTSVCSEDIRELPNHNKAKSVGELAGLFGYVTYTADYYHRHKGDALGDNAAAAVEPELEAGKDLHLLLFLNSTQQIMAWWVTDAKSKLKRHVQQLQESAGAETGGFEVLNLQLFAARSMTQLDYLFPVNEKRYADVAAALEEKIRSICSDVTLDIKAERYEQVAEFFQNKNLDTEAEREINRSILDELTACVEVKLVAAKEKLEALVLNVTNLSATDSLARDVTSLRSAVQYMSRILNEPLRSTVKADLLEVECALLTKAMNFLGTADSHVLNLELSVVEEVHQMILAILRAFFGSEEGYEAYAMANDLATAGISIDIAQKKAEVAKHVHKLIEELQTDFAAAVALSAVVGTPAPDVDFSANSDADFSSKMSNALGSRLKGKSVPPAIPPRPAPVARQTSSNRSLRLDAYDPTAVDKSAPLDVLTSTVCRIIPKRVVDALCAASKVGSAAFYMKLEADFVQFLTEQLGELLSQAHNTALPSDAREKILVTLEKCLAVLPQAMTGKINPVVHECKQELGRERDNFRTEMAQGDAKDIVGLVSGYRRYYKDRCFQYTYETQLLISQKIRASVDTYTAELKAGNLLSVLQLLPLVWAPWVKYFYLSDRMNEDALYVRQIFRINKQHAIFDTERYDSVLDLIAQLVQMITQFVAGLVHIAPTDPKAFQVYTGRFDVLIALIQLRSTSAELFNQLQHSSKLLHGLQQQLATIFDRIAGLFLHYTESATSCLKNGAWPVPVAAVLDVYQESDVLWNKINDVVLKGLATAEFVPVAATLKKCKPYAEVKTMIMSALRATAKATTVTLLHNSALSTRTPLDRDAFYGPYFDQYIVIANSAALRYHVDPAILTETAETSQKAMLEELRKIQAFLSTLIHDCIPGPDPSKYDEFKIWYDNLRSFCEMAAKSGLENDPLPQKATTLMKAVQGQLYSKLDNVQSAAANTSSTDEIITTKLFQLKQVSNALPPFAGYFNIQIDLALRTIKAAAGLQRIIDISLLLTKASSDPDVGATYQSILREHTAFQGVAQSMFNDRIARFTVADALNETNGITSENPSDIVRAKLTSHYELFKTAYQAVVAAGLLDVPSALDKIKQNVKDSVRVTTDSTTSARLDRIRGLLVNLFAYWTLSKSEHYMEMTSIATSSTPKEDNNKYLLQPHVCQVLSLFRIFGFDDNAGKIENHMIQIGTGEGKSIILAMCSAVLALLGHTVHCVCYSQYLSERDHKAFSYLFTEFGISEHVTYGTFQMLCEQVIEEMAGGDIRSSVVAMLSSKPPKAPRRPATGRPKVLLIDEVDVFFTDEFYGNTYRPLAKLVDPTVTALLDAIWGNRLQPRLTIAHIMALKEYQNCVSKFSAYAKVIEEATKTMIVDLRAAKDHKKLYKVINGQIGYKEQDRVSFDITHGYQTVFAYYQEHRDGNVDQATLDKRKYILIDCGAISYAEVPKMYKYLLGVSGTLKDLSERQKKLLRVEYAIQKYTYTPSVYGKTKLDFAGDCDIEIEVGNGHFNAITNKIVECANKVPGVVRPVLVFFKSAEELKRYYQSPAPGNLKQNMQIVTEEVSAYDKDSIFRQATSRGCVTLLSREFGRGTDFVIFDNKVRENGGMHVIQTFLSEEVSEETQIKGRAARQGCKGSYSMVLSAPELEPFDILETGPGSVQEMKNKRAYVDNINAKRAARLNLLWGGTQINVGQILTLHRDTLQFIENLKNGRASPFIATHLAKQNKSSYVELQAESRTVIVMDATGSMSGLINNAKNCVKTMFERANAMIELKRPGSTFEVQFVAYRNYNAPSEELMVNSRWENGPENLFRFIDSVNANYGQGNEAVEIGLWHANELIRQEPSRGISQVILIGDMPPNTESNVSTNRGRRGEAYWAGTPYSTPTHYIKEVQQLVTKKVKIHTFYVNNDCAKAAFQDIATRSGGECSFLDLRTDPAQAAENFTHFMTTKILADLGGGNAAVSAELVNAYKSTYGYVK